MLDISSTVATARFKWVQAADGGSTGRAMLAAFRRIGLRLQRTIMQNASDALLRRRTGNLTRAVTYRLEGSESSAELVVRAGVDLSRAVYGRIQNFGGIIKPVNGKFLTIPVGVNKTGNGVMRVSAREFIRNPGSIGFTGSFVNRAKTAIMGVRENGKIEPVFALKTSVKIRKTGFVTNALAQDEDYILDQVSGAAADVTRELAD